MASDDSPAANAAPGPAPTPGEGRARSPRDGGGHDKKRHRDNFRSNNNRDKKRKHGGFGSKGGRRGPQPSRDQAERERSAKRQKVIEADANGKSYMKINFSAEEIAAEERRPKRKVAVMVGYAGTGYSGLQMNHTEKTIEGDLFAAFVAAGAISKANADDPKKSSLVRCARTDKGVHAAGNVLSLKLIIEDDGLIDKINDNLPPQIRVWDIQRTNNGFSSYQACDSRWYEYLMPSYALLPPHPNSFLGEKLAESAKEKGVQDEFMERLADVKGFWEDVESTEIQPLLEKLSPEVRAVVLEGTHGAQAENLEGKDAPEAPDHKPTDQPVPDAALDAAATANESGGEAAAVGSEPGLASGTHTHSPAEAALKEVRAAYVAAKRRYRITPARLEKLQKCLDVYLGTNNFHNYTVQKTVSDPSAKRHIRSMVVNPTPIPIGDTEWLSIKVHGQSFMMHQIRKMIAMAVMVTRCGTPIDVIKESYGPRRISIPKAPGLGLLLERPVFDEYNKRATGQLQRDAIDFSKYDAKIQEFKDREIYRRMFEAEETTNAFHSFFQQLDNFRTDYFLWVTAGGIESSYQRTDRGGDRIPKALEAELGDEADGVQEGDD